MGDDVGIDSFFTRRDLVRTAAGVAGGLALGGTLARDLAHAGMSRAGRTAATTITFGHLADLTGAFSQYGIADYNAVKLAVASINARGGVLGKKLKDKTSDTQSTSGDKAIQFTNAFISNDDVPMVIMAQGSSIREAIRPIFDRTNNLLVYAAFYEGGVCDRNVLITGSSASQQIRLLAKWARKNLGSRLYTIAADYNYGQISAQWMKKYFEEAGGKVVGEDLIPFSITNFSSTLSRLQNAKPDILFALPVGAGQLSLLPQITAAGLRDKMEVISTNWGSGNEQLLVSPEVNDGIIVFTDYVQDVKTRANKTLVAAWRKRFGKKLSITGPAVENWVGLHLWAKAANRAGSTDPRAVMKALEKRLSFDGPGGPVYTDPKTHHVVLTMHLVKGNKKRGFTPLDIFPNVPPTFERSVCNLIKQPNTKKQFTP